MVTKNHSYIKFFIPKYTQFKYIPPLYVCIFHIFIYIIYLVCNVIRNTNLSFFYIKMIKTQTHHLHRSIYIFLVIYKLKINFHINLFHSGLAHVVTTSIHGYKPNILMLVPLNIAWSFVTSHLAEHPFNSVSASIYLKATQPRDYL